MSKYIYQYKRWPDFQWDANAIAALLAKVKFDRGRLIGQMENMGFQLNQRGLAFSDDRRGH